MPITVNFEHKSETKTCHRFESRVGGDFITLYLKKSQLEEAGINPAEGLAVTIAQRKSV